MEVNELRSWTIVWALVVLSCTLALNSQPACWLYFQFYSHFYSLLIIWFVISFVIRKLQTWNCALWRVKFLNYTASLRLSERRANPDFCYPEHEQTHDGFLNPAQSYDNRNWRWDTLKQFETISNNKACFSRDSPCKSRLFFVLDFVELLLHSDMKIKAFLLAYLSFFSYLCSEKKK